MYINFKFATTVSNKYKSVRKKVLNLVNSKKYLSLPDLNVILLKIYKIPLIIAGKFSTLFKNMARLNFGQVKKSICI